MCNNNSLTTLDVSNNTSLVKFYCNDNKLPRINVTANTALQEFNIANNLLSVLNVRNNTALTYLNASNNVEISMVDVKYNTAIQELYTEGLPAVTEIDLTQNSKLTKYEFTNCPNLVNINVGATFTMDKCLFTSAGNNPSLSINNASNKIFYYIGQYTTAFGSAGVVYTITNGGLTGKLISAKETEAQWDDAYSWCSNYGAGYYMPSRAELIDMSKLFAVINSSLSDNGCTALSTDSYWSTSSDSNGHIPVSLSSGWSSNWGYSGTYKFRVRAIRAF